MIWNYKERYGKVDEVAFFHCGDVAEQFLLLCKPYPIRISGNPLDINKITLARFADAGGHRVELNLPSLNDLVLREIRSGYDSTFVLELIEQIKAHSLQVGVVLSPGLPLYSAEAILKDVATVIERNVSYVNIVPCLVWAGSGLASRYAIGGWEPMNVEGAVQICREMVDRLSAANIPVPRIGIQPGQDIQATAIAGPNHPNLRSLVQFRRFYDMMVAALAGHKHSSAKLIVHPKDVSLAKGEGGENIQKLRRRLGLSEVIVTTSEAVKRGQVKKEEE